MALPLKIMTYHVSPHSGLLVAEYAFPTECVKRLSFAHEVLVLVADASRPEMVIRSMDITISFQVNRVEGYGRLQGWNK